MTEIRAKHPRFVAAVAADTKVACAFRGERFQFRGRADLVGQVLRLMWVSDAFAAQVAYRAKARMQALGIPILPRLAHHFAMAKAQVCIGDPVVIHPGVYIAHGQVVVGGLVEIHRGVVIFPWVTIGLRSGHIVGPTIGKNVSLGTGAKLVGPITVGEGAKVGANAVVVDDVAAHSTVGGIPARPL